MNTDTGMVDFVTPWGQIWSDISGGMSPEATSLLTKVGVVIVVFAIVKYVWDNHQGRGPDLTKLGWTLLVGAIFAAPGGVIPILLRAAESVVNVVIAAA